MNLLNQYNSVIIPSALTLGTLAGAYAISRNFHAKCNITADLNGKTIIITGANTGIGKETAIELAKMGAAVIIGCRNSEKSKAALIEIKKQSKNENVKLIDLDLSSFESVRKFCNDFKNLNLPIHILINNAGIMGTPFERTKDGFESQFGVNHLGHFLLTTELLPILIENKARIVNVSSEGHRMASSIHVDSFTGNPDKYQKWIAYGQSKLSNILFAAELQRRYGKDGISAVSLHPGVVNTELMRSNQLLDSVAKKLFFVQWFFKTPLQGAQTSIYCAIAPGIVGGKYYKDCKLAKSSNASLDEATAKKLWDVSEELVKKKAN